MTWADPRGDLRLLLNDDQNGHLIKEKALFPVRASGSTGLVRRFMTFEDRLVASGNQSVCGQPMRVFLTDEGSGLVTEVAASGITILDQERGELELMIQPSGQQIRATYHYRNWLDAELDFCLLQGAKQVNAGSADQVDDGLQLACLDIAASLAHRRAASRWLDRKSAQFVLEEAVPADQMQERVQFHVSQAETLMTEGYAARLAFYDTRMDRGKSPAFKLLARTPRPYTPRR